MESKIYEQLRELATKHKVCIITATQVKPVGQYKPISTKVEGDPDLVLLDYPDLIIKKREW